MSSRTKAREQALQILFFWDVSGGKPEDAISYFESCFETYSNELPFTKSLVQGVASHLDRIDQAIKMACENWRLNRIPRIDRNILRLGAYELIFCKDVPTSVALNEAVELGKKFGESKTGAFVNGILDRISRELQKDL